MSRESWTRVGAVVMLAHTMLACFLLAATCLQAVARPRADGNADIASLQYLLAWSGDYTGEVDGHQGLTLLHAVREVQRRHGRKVNGMPDSALLRRMVSAAGKVTDGVGYSLVTDPATGAIHGLPGKLAGPAARTADGTAYGGGAATFSLALDRYPARQKNLLQLYREISQSAQAKPLTVDAFRGDHFMLRWLDGSTVHAVRFDDRFGEIRGMRLSIDSSRYPQAAAMAAAMIFDFAGFAETPRGELLRVPVLASLASALRAGADPAFAGRSEDAGSRTTYGSGFTVSQQGHVLTSAHVVRHCDDIKLTGKATARVIAVDEAIDLALLLEPTLAGKPFAHFAAEKPRLGEEVAAFGFPLRSILADQLNMTTGIISSLAGLGGNAKLLQITAPVQRGNSGGPIVDQAARVLGVVTSSLDALSVARSVGQLPQSINFAVRSELAQRFLERHGVQPELRPPAEKLASVEVAALAQAFVVPVTCAKGE